MDQFILLLKNVTNEAARLREASWRADLTGYDKDTEASVLEACRELGVPATVAPLIWLALTNNWNDVLAWADGEYDSSFTPDGYMVSVASPEEQLAEQAKLIGMGILVEEK